MDQNVLNDIKAFGVSHFKTSWVQVKPFRPSRDVLECHRHRCRIFFTDSASKERSSPVMFNSKVLACVNDHARYRLSCLMTVAPNTIGRSVRIVAVVSAPDQRSYSLQPSASDCLLYATHCLPYVAKFSRPKIFANRFQKGGQKYSRQKYSRRGGSDTLRNTQTWLLCVVWLVGSLTVQGRSH